MTTPTLSPREAMQNYPVKFRRERLDQNLADRHKMTLAMQAASNLKKTSAPICWRSGFCTFHTHTQVGKKCFKHQILSLHARIHFRIVAIDGRGSESAIVHTMMKMNIKVMMKMNIGEQQCWWWWWWFFEEDRASPYPLPRSASHRFSAFDSPRTWAFWEPWCRRGFNVEIGSQGVVCLLIHTYIHIHMYGIYSNIHVWCLHILYCIVYERLSCVICIYLSFTIFTNLKQLCLQTCYIDFFIYRYMPKLLHNSPSWNVGLLKVGNFATSQQDMSSSRLSAIWSKNARRYRLHSFCFKTGFFMSPDAFWHPSGQLVAFWNYAKRRGPVASLKSTLHTMTGGLDEKEFSQEIYGPIFGNKVVVNWTFWDIATHSYLGFGYSTIPFITPFQALRIEKTGWPP